MKKPSVLVVRGAFGEMYEPAWNRALNENGVNSRIFDCHSRVMPGIIGRVEQRILFGPGITKVRRDLIREIKNTRPDIVLLYQGHYIDFETAEEISRHSFLTGYHNDDPFGSSSGYLRYRHFHESLKAYDGYHVYRQVNRSEVLAAGVKKASILMPAFMPWMDYPRNLSIAEKINFDSDLLFAGHCESDLRIDCMLSVLRSGMKLKVYGDNQSWKKTASPELFKLVGPLKHILNNDYRRAISGSRISLCFFSKKNRDEYTRRVFEITACQGFLMSERSPRMLELFPEGKSAVYFSSPEELNDKAKFYLAHPSERLRIARSGYELVHKAGHDLHSRLRQWLGEVEKWRN